MEQRRLGDSGLVVSAVGLGCNNLGRPGTGTETLEGAQATVGIALDSGITLFDVADAYGSPRGRSEELLGHALGRRRDEAVIATKFGTDMPDSGPSYTARGSRLYVRRAVEASLHRLGTDRIDLYQLHRPDPGTPIAETLGVLDDLVREGKIRYAGLSNLAGWQLADAAWTARAGGLSAPVSAQNHYSLLARDTEREVAPACERFGIGLLPYFPLANGLLTGKYQKGRKAPEGSRLAERSRMLDEAPWDRIEQLRNFAETREVPMTTVAVGWLLSNRVVGSVICGATTPEQILGNIAAGRWRPTDGDRAEIDAICPPYRN